MSRPLRYLRSRLGGVIDPLRTPRRAIYVTGSARSGTTWVAELLRDALGARLVFEPLHHQSALPGSPHFRAQDADDPELRRMLRQALSGTVNDDWVNVFQPDGVFARRVVKDIRPGVLPLVRAVAPEMPVILLIRHPIEVAVSRAELEQGEGEWWDTAGAVDELREAASSVGGWLSALAAIGLDALDQEPAPLGSHVVIWCVENAVALSLFPLDRGLALRYEDLLAEPEPHLRSIEELCAVELPRGEALTRPSVTSFRGADHIGKLGSWRSAVPMDEAERLLAITRRFGLDHLYGSDPTVDLPPMDGSPRMA